MKEMISEGFDVVVSSFLLGLFTGFYAILTSVLALRELKVKPRGRSLVEALSEVCSKVVSSGRGFTWLVVDLVLTFGVYWMGDYLISLAARTFRIAYVDALIYVFLPPFVAGGFIGGFTSWKLASEASLR